MGALLHVCVALAVLFSIVQCDRQQGRTPHPRRNTDGHSHGHGHGHSHGHGHGHSHSHGKGHDHHTDGSLTLDFAFNLYKHISAQPDSQSKNVFFSPLSVSVALAALSLGARGKTHQQLFEGLGFNSTEISTVNQAFQHIHHNLNSKTDVDLSLGNALFIGQDFKPRPDFLVSMKRFYQSEGFNTNFSKVEEAKDLINNYVSNKTNGKITDLVQDVDPLTVMYLINYVYFKGEA